MNFLLLFLLGLVVLILTTVVMNGLVKNFKKRFPECDSVPFMSGMTVLLSSLCIGLYFSWETKITIPVLCLFLVLCILQQILLTFQNKTREILLFLVCFGTTFLIPTDSAFFKAFPFISGQLLLGGLLYLMTRLFSFMDKINGYSLARLFGLGILFILFFHFHILPNSLQVPFFLLFISFIGTIQTVKTLTNDHKAVLGPFASVLVGFEVGIFICYVVSKGAYSFPIALYSLDITEIILASITTLFINRHIYPLTQPLPIEQAYNKGFETKKLNRFIFSILLIQTVPAITKKYPNGRKT